MIEKRIKNLDIVVLDGDLAYIVIDGVTYRNLKFKPKGILEVRDVKLYKAEYCPDEGMRDACFN